VETQQLWLLGLVNGVWGVFAAALLVVALGWGMSAFLLIAAFGYVITAASSLVPLFRTPAASLRFVRADLDYQLSITRSRRDEEHKHLTRLRTQCHDVRRGRFVRQQIKDAQSELATLRENAVCQVEYDRAMIELQRLRSVLGQARYDLLATDWRSLRGVPFEDFLTRVFQLLGYHVQTTKTTGDQGVDLIVFRNGQRIAIQAKGYAGSVGNDAVQQAHAGMAFYQCDRCAVITNSRFTRGAVELAVRVKCSLIDGQSILSLINGKVL
jgi:restriction endonuclease Mrr